MIYSFSISIFLCIKINKLKVLNNINIKKTKNKPIFLLFPIIIVTSKNKLKKKSVPSGIRTHDPHRVKVVS